MSNRRANAIAQDGADGIAPAVRGKLAKLGITTLCDLLLHLPLRYEDETRLCEIAAAPPGASVLVEAVVESSSVQYRPRRTLVCRVRDRSGELHLRFLNFYPSQIKQLVPGVRLRLLGEIRDGFFGAEMVHPRYRVVQEGAPLAQTLTPVYPTTAGLSQAVLGKLAQRALSACDLGDTLPAQWLQRLNLPAFESSIRLLHQPPPGTALPELVERRHPAWRRVKFDELLAQQLALRINHRNRHRRGAPALPACGQLTRALLERLPFALTKAQEHAWQDIARELAQPHPMQRLLQGDVGSGKTVVAALAALQAVENGCQAAVMAPTEILAEQHFRKFSEWLAPLGVEVAWLSGALRKKDRQAALQKVADGGAQVAVGTHALFQEQVAFQKLALAIVDEQHRFGVHQRLALHTKGAQGGEVPHQLMMSATPIPRTLAMSYYADLDVSVIAELPPGRTPVTTKLVDEQRRSEIVQRVRDACMAGGQAYWVCPLIEESEALQLQTALETHQTLLQTFPELKVGLVHGRLPQQEKAAVMEAFQRGDIHLLVATTVIEVGVDVPNATLMVIEHAERMGLSQLHQLRGRVGRGTAQSLCILLYQQPLGPTARERLKIIYENSDGFEVARHDLRLRGPGEFLGSRQSGMPILRFADLEADLDLLEAARGTAEQLLTSDMATVQRHLARWLGDRHNYLRV
ncbi:MAG: ATP-dependent DNA helicase RecG [Pseudomonadota bacterium]